MFGKEDDRRHQWSLLGALLRGLPLTDALEALDRAFGSKLVPWVRLREQAAAGETLYKAARHPELKTPVEVLNALEDGEKDGSLPDRLDRLRETAVEAAPAPVDPGIVTLVNAVLMAAAEGNASGLMFRLLPTGDGQVKIYQGDAWTLHSRHPADEFSAMVRRLLVLCAQPYWDPKPGVFRMPLRQGLMEIRVTPDGQGGLGLELLPFFA